MRTSHHSLQQRLSTLNRRLGRGLPKRRVTAQPFYAQTDTDIAGLRRNYGQTLSSLAGQRAQVETQYGFSNSANPYSVAANLARGYAQRQTGRLNNYAASGQLYSGALESAREGDRTVYGQQVDTAAQRYQALLARLAAAQTSAGSRYSQGVQQANAKQLQNAVNTPLEPGVAPAHQRRSSRRRQQPRRHR